jgi:hypothetical protein
MPYGSILAEIGRKSQRNWGKWGRTAKSDGVFPVERNLFRFARKNGGQRNEFRSTKQTLQLSWGEVGGRLDFRFGDRNRGSIGIKFRK